MSAVPEIDPDPTPQPVRLAMPDGTTRQAELTLPGPREDAPAGGWPGVVVLHDVFGFSGDTRRHLRNFAAAGYAAIAPRLYARDSIRCVVSTLVALKRTQGEPLTVIEAARTALRDDPDVDTTRIGITGFCMGGGFALLAAADGAYAVAAPFYGDVPARRDRLRGLCPTLAQYGGTDLMFRSHAPRLVAHLEALGIEHEVIVYDGIGHSFMNQHDSRLFDLARFTPMRAAHDPETEAIAWARLLDFFERHTKD